MRIMACLLLVLSVAVAGCGGPSPEAVTESYLDAMVAGDVEAAAEYVVADSGESVTDQLTSEDQEVLTNLILEKVTYEIKSSAVDGDSAVVHASITAPNLAIIITQVMSEMMPMAFALGDEGQEAANNLVDQMLRNAIAAEDVPLTTTDVAINLVKEDGQWLIAAENEELGNALIGNAKEAFEGFEMNQDPEKAEESALTFTDHAVGEPLTVAASTLNPIMGQPDLTGNITVTVEEYEFATGIEDAFTSEGTIQPRGRFLVIYYSVANDLNVEMQPATQIANDLYITDAQGRRWESVDYTADYGGVSGSAAVAKGYRQPEEMVPPGFKNITAVVFDLPQDATDDLALVWEDAGIRIALQ